MKTRAYLKYQFHLYMLRWRWLSPIAVGLVLGYWAGKTLLAFNPLGSKMQFNALEGFIWAFGKPEIVYFVISVLFVYLVSDSGLNRYSEGQVLMQLKSRGKWWLGKIAFLFLETVSYTTLLLVSFFLPLLIQYPISNEWSPAATLQGGINLGYATLDGTPVQAFWNILLFLMVGWFAIGLLILCIQLLFKRTWAAFLGGALLILYSKLGWIGGSRQIGGSGIESIFLLQNHLEYTPLWAPVRMIPQAYSWIFWSAWILICLGATWIICKQHNFYSQQSSGGFND